MQNRHAVNLSIVQLKLADRQQTAIVQVHTGFNIPVAFHLRLSAAAFLAKPLEPGSAAGLRASTAACPEW